MLHNNNGSAPTSGATGNGRRPAPQQEQDNRSDRPRQEALLSRAARYAIEGLERDGQGAWRVKSTNPCPVCGHPDYCRVDPQGRVALCARDRGGEQFGDNGGFLHILDQGHFGGDALAFIPRPVERRPEPQPLSPPERQRRHDAYAAFLAAFPDASGHDHLAPLRAKLPAAIDLLGARLLPAQGSPEASAALALLADAHGWQFFSEVPGFRHPGRLEAALPWGCPALAFPSRGWDGFIEGVHFRRLAQDDGEGGKYRWLSGETFGGQPRDATNKHLPAAWYRPALSRQPAEAFLIVTEGQKKAAAAAAALECPAVSVPGVNQWGAIMPALEKLDPQRKLSVRLAFDMDQNKNDHVKRALKNLQEAIFKTGREVQTGAWPAQFKGLDDILLADGQEIGAISWETFDPVAAWDREICEQLEAVKKLSLADRNQALGAIYEREANEDKLIADAITDQAIKILPDIKRSTLNAIACKARKALAAQRKADQKAARQQTGQTALASAPIVRLSDRPLVDPLGGPSPEAEAWAALLDGPHGADLFVRDGVLVALREKSGELRPVPIAEAELWRRLMASTLWLRSKRAGESQIDTHSQPPPELVKAMLAVPDPAVRPLRRIVFAPFFTAEGRLVSAPGYDAETQTWLELGALASMPKVAPVPSREDAREALRLLLGELTGEFPFDSPASRANWLALAISPFLREMTGLVPVGLLDADRPGSGKTTLATLIGALASGGAPAVDSLNPRDDDEARKLITSALLEGRQTVIFDNLSQASYLDLPVLAKTVTAAAPSDRRLGTNETARLSNKAVWFLTGNNVRCSNELARRSILVRLHAGVERPDKRIGFRIKDLLAHSLKHRSRYVWAILTLIQRWIAAGCPDGSGGPAAPFTSWGLAVSGVLETNGVFAFDANRDRLEANVDAEATEARELFETWRRDLLPTLTATQLFNLANQRGLLAAVLGDGNDRSQTTRLGKWLKSRLGQVFEIDGHTVELRREPGKCASWTLAPCAKRPLKPVVFDLDAPGALGLPANRADVADVGADVVAQRPGALSPVGNRVSEDVADVADVFSAQRGREDQNSFSSGATPNGSGEKKKIHPHAGGGGEKRPQRPQQVHNANCEQGSEAPDVEPKRPQPRPQRPQTPTLDNQSPTVHSHFTELSPDGVEQRRLDAISALSIRMTLAQREAWRKKATYWDALETPQSEAYERALNEIFFVEIRAARQWVRDQLSASQIAATNAMERQLSAAGELSAPAFFQALALLAPPAPKDAPWLDAAGILIGGAKN